MPYFFLQFRNLTKILPARSCGPLVTTSTLEVVIPQHAVAKLVRKSKDMVSQISEVMTVFLSQL